MTGPAARSGRTLLVVAKAPEAGRVKTRLVPPLAFVGAADIASAALADSTDAAAAWACGRVVGALVGDWPASQSAILRGVAQRLHLA